MAQSDDEQDVVALARDLVRRSTTVEQLLAQAEPQIERQEAAFDATPPSSSAGSEQQRSDSHDCSQESSTPSRHCRTTAWWAPLIKGHSKQYELTGESMHQRTLVSACSGCLPEAEVMKARSTFAVVALSRCNTWSIKTFFKKNISAYSLRMMC